LGQASAMYFDEVKDDFCSSPASMRDGAPLTMSCFEVGVGRTWGVGIAFWGDGVWIDGR
jgi:hypothetical protein